MRTQNNSEYKKLYIVISQTGTVLSKILRFITGADYNHASLSLRDDLSLMYSFGRINPYNPFVGGFVTESSEFGTFKRFKNTKIIVISFDVTCQQYQDMLNQLEEMYKFKNRYAYNYLGLYLAAIKIHRKKKNCYYCSEFVKDFLQMFEIKGASELEGIVHPMDFLNMPDFKDVYRGRLRDYCVKAEVEVG